MAAALRLHQCGDRLRTLKAERAGISQSTGGPCLPACTCAFRLFQHFKRTDMKHPILISALLAALALAACDRPTVVNVPTPVAVPTPVPVPGPPGPTGATGNTGAPGKSGDTTAIIVVPAASAPAN